MLMLTLSIVVAGFSPVQAKSGCQMAVKMQMQHTDGHDCDHCDKNAKHEHKKRNCCGDMACGNQCSSAGVMSMNLSIFNVTSNGFTSEVSHFYPADAVLASAYLSSKERPPKSLA